MTEHLVLGLYEDKEIRCPRLGGPITFSYCRIENQGRPCSKALNCWASHFDVESLFRKNMTPEEFEACFFGPPPSKVGTLLELIEKARKVIEKDEDKDDKI
ncbi:MAG: hypothetical protein P8182_13135 [Deltaproteobacteria bacterium]